MFKPLTCKPGIYGEADTDSECGEMDKIDRNCPQTVASPLALGAA